MAVTHGSFGRVRGGSHFLSQDIAATWNATLFRADGVSVISVNEGSIAYTVDEPGGIVALTTDTGDNDNVTLFLGTFQPSAGGCFMETRFKFNSASVGAVFAGFTETLVIATPVMPAEFDTATMTYNGSGGMAGVNFDTDATTADFRAVAGDGGAAAGSTVGGDTVTNGIRANQTIAADEWYIVKVELGAGGHPRMYVGHDKSGMELVADYNGTAPVTNTDQFHAVLMFENRSAAARLFEVDYFYAEGSVDWEVT
jgi:hypothetical protein